MGGAQSQDKHTLSPTFHSQPDVGLLTPPEEADFDLLGPGKTLAGGNDSSEEEKESFQGWLSHSSASERGSMGSRGPSGTPHQAGGDGVPSVPGSIVSIPSITSHDVPSIPSSGNWLGQRPSIDTPLPTGTSVSSPAASKRPSTSFAQTRQHPPPRPPSQYSARSSGSSAGRISGQLSGGASVRSSFALERASLEASRYSLEAFQEAHRAQEAAGPSQSSDIPQQAFADLELAGSDAAGASLDLLLRMTRLGPELRDPLAALCVLPPSTPVPLSMLQRLWHTSEDHGIAILEQLATHGVVSVAKLPNGQTWALPQAQQLQLLQAACRDCAPGYHARLVQAYCNADDGKQTKLADIPDDGYILGNICYHLISAGKALEAKALLLDLGWLDRKLLACGAGSVVADFRRFLMFDGERDVKVVLEAFQMSVGLATAHRKENAPGLLRCLMMARLMTIPLSPHMQAWLEGQRAAARAVAGAAAAAGRPQCLPATTPSLDQAGGLQRLALKGHRGAISKVILTPSGTEAVSVSADGTARLWDMEIGDCVLTMEGHAGGINDIAISADGSLLVTCSDDGTARAYEMERGQCLRVLAGHKGAINALAMDPLGRFVATGGADGTARVFDLASARAVHVLTAPGGVCSLAMSPCTRYLLLGCGDCSVRVFDVISGQAMGVMQGHTGRVSAVAFTPDGKRAISASYDGTLRSWSLRSGRCSRVFEGHTARVNAMALSTDGKTLASASDDGRVRVWTVKTGACRLVLQGHRAWISNVALSQENDRLVSTSGDGTAICWSLDSGEPVRVLEGHSGPVLAAAITRRGRFAVTASEDCSLRVWDFAACSGHTPKWHEGRIRALAARDGVVVATAGDDCVARLWDASLGEYRGLLHGHAVPIRWAYFSPDGSHLMTASPDRDVRVWNASTMKLVHRLPAQQGSRVKCFAAGANLERATVCLFDGSVTVWDLTKAEPVITLQARGVRDEAKGHTSAVNEVLMKADGGTVVTLSKDTTVRVWDVATGSCRRVLRGHTDVITGGCLSDEGNLLATHAYDHTVRLWSIDSGECVACMALDADVTHMALSRCGWRLAAAFADGRVMLCDLQHPEEGCVRVHGHTDEVTGLSFSADGLRLLSCSVDCTARVVNAATGDLQGLFVSDCGLTCCHFDSVTECVVLGTDRGVVHFVDASTPHAANVSQILPK